MISVAQKSRFFWIFTIIVLLFTSFNTAKALQTRDIYQSEELHYNVFLKGIKIGKSFIKYQPNKENNTYKITTNTKTEGFIRSIMSLNDSFVTYGKIENNQLIPGSHTLILKENRKRYNKTLQFLYNEKLAKVTNNSVKNDIRHYLIKNEAIDLFSDIYNLRYNTDLSTLDNNKELDFKRTHILTHKTYFNNIKLSKATNFKLSNGNIKQVRKASFMSKRYRQNPVDDELIEEYIKKPNDYYAEFLNKYYYEKTSKYKNTVSAVITNNVAKIPLVIEYDTIFGKFKAVLTKMK